MELNTIYNEDCIKTMENLIIGNDKVDCVITSPPYNMTKRKGGYADSGRYDVYTDWKPEEEYISWTVDIFNMFDRILNENRTIIYNFSYSIENPALPYKLIANIEDKTINIKRMLSENYENIYHPTQPRLARAMIPAAGT